MSARIRETAGMLLGALSAPFFAAVSFARHARTFHPDGLVFLADAQRHPLVMPEDGSLADRLAGPAIVRLSGALWRRGFEHVDVLGLALRFRRTSAPSAVPEEGDQDLLMATILSPFSMPFSPLTTDSGDYLSNTYYAVSPFVTEHRNVKLRIVPERDARSAAAAGDRTREERLNTLLQRGPVRFRLDVRSTFIWPWRPVMTIELTRPIALDQEALRFSPFRTRRGLEPRGLVHALRKAAYPASQWGRRKAVGG